MKINFSVQDTGACPICKKRKNCLILRKIKSSLNEIDDGEEMLMELVIYMCPRFNEEV